MTVFLVWKSNSCVFWHGFYMELKKQSIMKNILAFLALSATLLLTACNSTSPMGEKVKEPFQGSKYESNNRFFRGVGKGMSAKDNIARGKADMEAKNQLSGQVETNIRNVTDQYMAQTENANTADIAEKFQSLTRQVMNNNLADLRKIGEEKFFDGEKYTVFIADE